MRDCYHWPGDYVSTALLEDGLQTLLLLDCLLFSLDGLAIYGQVLEVEAGVFDAVAEDGPPGQQSQHL